MTTILDTTRLSGKDQLKRLASRQGPCLTMTIPDHHPGAPEGSPRAVVRSLVKTAADRLAATRLAPTASTLLEPIEELAHDPALETGGPGLAIFRAPGFVSHFNVPGQPERLTIGSHFNLTPFLAQAAASQDVLVLGLSTKRLHLFEFSSGECREMELPAGVPATLEGAGQFNRSESGLENRSPAGANAGGLRGVRFGTTTDRESAGEYLHDFFEIVDRGLKPVLAGRPLLLLGVKEEVAAYRRAARNDHVVWTGRPGSPDNLTPSEIAPQVTEAALADYHRRGEEALAEYREMPDRKRTLADAREILRAAAQGRVHRLCIREGTSLPGPMEQELDRAFLAEEDLANAAVVETLRTNGDVFVLPQDRMPAGQPLAAILRY